MANPIPSAESKNHGSVYVCMHSITATVPRQTSTITENGMWLPVRWYRKQSHMQMTHRYSKGPPLHPPLLPSLSFLEFKLGNKNKHTHKWNNASNSTEYKILHFRQAYNNPAVTLHTLRLWSGIYITLLITLSTGTQLFFFLFGKASFFFLYITVVLERWSTWNREDGNLSLRKLWPPELWSVTMAVLGDPAHGWRSRTSNPKLYLWADEQRAIVISVLPCWPFTFHCCIFPLTHFWR